MNFFSKFLSQIVFVILLSKLCAADQMQQINMKDLEEFVM